MFSKFKELRMHSSNLVDSFIVGVEQKKLIMVGSCKTLSKVPLLRLLIEKVEELSGMMVVSNKEIKYQLELKRCSQLV